jgi:HEAT repeat protein
VKEIQGVLRALHGSAAVPDLVRRMCLEASVRAPEPWHAEAVRGAYARPEQPWKMTALFCMGRVEGFENEILAALDSSEVELAVEAVRAAGCLEVAAAGPRVLRLAASGTADARVRYAAIEALATIETEGADELLVSLTESEDELLAQLAFESLEERRVFSEPPDSGT